MEYATIMIPKRLQNDTRSCDIRDGHQTRKPENYMYSFSRFWGAPMMYSNCQQLRRLRAIANDFIYRCICPFSRDNPKAAPLLTIRRHEEEG